MKKIGIIFTLVLMIVFSTVVNASPGKSDVKVAKNEQGKYVTGYIVIPEIEPLYNSVGDITGDGVNLRAKPSTNSTILEVMYRGEVVNIYYDKSGGWEGGYRWLYVMRHKTGTYGWVYGKYVADWD